MLSRLNPTRVGSLTGRPGLRAPATPTRRPQCHRRGSRRRCRVLGGQALASSARSNHGFLAPESAAAPSTGAPSAGRRSFQRTADTSHLQPATATGSHDRAYVWELRQRHLREGLHPGPGHTSTTGGRASPRGRRRCPCRRARAHVRRSNDLTDRCARRQGLRTLIPLSW